MLQFFFAESPAGTGVDGYHDGCDIHAILRRADDESGRWGVGGVVTACCIGEGCAVCCVGCVYLGELCERYGGTERVTDWCWWVGFRRR